MAMTSFRSDKRGAVLVLFTLILPVMIGLMALVIDVSMTLYRKNEAQRVADAAAMSAIRAATSSSMYSTDGNAIEAGKYEAYEVAKLNGFPNPCSAVSNVPPCVIVNSPPTFATSKYLNVNGAFEVTIIIPQTQIFSRYFSATAGTATVRAVSEGSSPCILVLNKTNAGTLTFGGGGSINAQCAILVNSGYNAASNTGTVIFSGGTSAQVGSLTLRNGTQVYSNSKPTGDPCTFSTQNVLNCPYFSMPDAVPNPLSDHNVYYTSSYPSTTVPSVPAGASTTLPSNSTINGVNYNISTSQTFDKNTLKNSNLTNSYFAVSGLKLSTDMTLNSGASLVVNGSLQVGGNLTLNSGSTLYVTGTLQVSNNLTINSGANIYALGGTTIDSGAILKSVATLPTDIFYMQGGITIKGTMDLTGSPSALFYIGDDTTSATTASSQIYFQGGGKLQVRNGTLALSPMTTFSGSGSGIVIDLESPTSGVWQNIVVFQRDPPPQSATDTLPYNPSAATSTGFNASGMTVNISGAFVMPYTRMSFSATSTASTKCAFFIVDSFDFQGSPTLGSGCALGQSFAGIGQGLLVE